MLSGNKITEFCDTFKCPDTNKVVGGGGITKGWGKVPSSPKFVQSPQLGGIRGPKHDLALLGKVCSKARPKSTLKLTENYPKYSEKLS